MDDNNMDYVTNDTFSSLRNLKPVWVPGNHMNCTHVEVGLSRSAVCIDSASCDYVLGDLGGIGGERCYDPYDNYECGWDGGDCDDAK